VRFGRDVIEVATFRAGSNEQDDDRSQDDSGRILRDNVYGNIDEDIWRRDFTVNALYYNIEDYSVWDYTGGMQDLRNRTLRLIDDPWTRYREDPVRMLRAVRFAAKLDFMIAPDAAAPIRDLGHLMADVPPARLFEEVLKLFHGGHAVKSFDLLVEHDLLRYLFPATAELIDGPTRESVLAFVRRGLGNTDQRIAEDKPITPMFLYAVLLWPAIAEITEKLQTEDGQTEFAAMHESLSRIVAEQVARTALPKRFGAPMKEILLMQRRFNQRRGARAARLLEHKRFRAAFDFMLLRASAGEVDQATVDWWQARQDPNQSEETAEPGVRRRRRSRRGGRRRSGNRSADSAGP
jgi:poly(A) polymerase